MQRLKIHQNTENKNECSGIYGSCTSIFSHPRCRGQCRREWTETVKVQRRRGELWMLSFCCDLLPSLQLIASVVSGTRTRTRAGHSESQHIGRRTWGSISSKGSFGTWGVLREVEEFSQRDLTTVGCPITVDRHTSMSKWVALSGFGAGVNNINKMKYSWRWEWYRIWGLWWSWKKVSGCEKIKIHYIKIFK